MTKPLRIIQTSNPGSGSTVLANILIAFFQPYENLTWMGKPYYNRDLVNDNIVIKTHHKRLDEWIEKFGDNYDLYFIISDRDDYDWHKYRDYKNVLFIKYDEILETEKNSVENICNNIFIKCNNFLPDNYMVYIRKNISIINAINRINNMNNRYKDIKNKPFDFVDKYYQLHGSHRNNNHTESLKTRALRK